MKLKLRATPEEVVRAVEALEEYARAQGLSDKTIFGLALALEECGINIVKHAYHCDAQQSFQVLLERNGDLFIIELRDHGSEFDPTAMAPRERRAVDKDAPGGWGIDLVRHYVDEVHYHRQAGENTLRLHKRLVPPTSQAEISPVKSAESDRETKSSKRTSHSKFKSKRISP